MKRTTRHTIGLVTVMIATLVASCTKDSERQISLRVDLESFRNANKSYIDSEGYSCWSNGDAVRINGANKNIVIANNQCRIYDVTYSEIGYTAIYPASIATNSSMSGYAISGLELPSIQQYSTDNQGRQMVPTVMAAHLDTPTGTINFYNACIALKITLVNNYARTLRLGSVTVSDDLAPLCGSFEITSMANGEPSLSYTGSTVSDLNRSVTLQLPQNGITLASNAMTTVYITLPPTAGYANNKFTIEVTAFDEEDITNGDAVTVYEFTHTQSTQGNGAIARNLMAPINIQLDEPHTLVLRGTGSENNPYRIYSVEDLRSMQHLVNAGHIPIGNGVPFASAHYLLMNDIAIGTTASNSLQPIGTPENNFIGHFDGNSHTLSGIYAAVGVFGYISQGASITNLTVSNATIDMTETPVGGIICAHADKSVIDHCRITGTASFVNIPSSATYMGGIVGEAAALTTSNSTITNCHCAATITLQTGNDAHRLGGIAGHLLNSSVCNCYTQVNTSSTTFTIGSAYVGGIVGRSDGASNIVNCYYGLNHSIVGTASHFGDLCAEISKTTHITYCYYSKKIHVIGIPSEEFITNVYPYDLMGGNAQYTVHSEHIGTLLNNTASTLHYASWTEPSSNTEAPQLSY